MIDPYALVNPGIGAEVGFSRVDITPAANAPINNWAVGRSRRATGVHLPLTGTAMYLGRGNDALVLVSLDLGWWRTDGVVDALRQSAAQQLGLSLAQVAICLTHTHAGPAVDPVAVGAEEMGDVRDYVDGLAEALAAAVDDARRVATPAVLEWARGECGLAHVRDQWREDERRFVCGYAPELAADQTLMVGRVTDDTGGLRGVIVNYACHPTSLGPHNTLLSPDYVGVAREVVERATGARMLFLQGASGELAPRRQYDADTAVVAANGEQLGHAVLSTLAGMLPAGTALEPEPTVESGAPLARWVPVRATSVQSTIAAAETWVGLPKNTRLGEWHPARGIGVNAEDERRARQRLVADDQQEPGLPVTIWRLGPAVLVAHPGEAYSVLQVELRAAFPEVPVIVANLANGRHRGYLPPADAYSTELYQVWQTPLGRGSLEAVIEHCVQQISLLTGERAPSRTKVVP